MATQISRTKKIIDLATDLDGYVRKNKWVSRYDTESDSFSVSQSKLSPDARIKYFNDEIAFYITKNNKVEGIFVEYFGSNFVKHHRDLASVLKGLKKKNNEEGLIELSKNKAKKITPDLEETLKLLLAEKINLEPKLG